jgi:DeoR family transcriptional regulator, fructose operon transcriptional repressor
MIIGGVNLKKTKSIVSKRRERIIEYLKANKTINTNKLADKLEISPLTLRRDLQALDEEGSVIRYYGGAKLVSNTMDDNSNIVSNTSGILDTKLVKKHTIAKYAASLINEGDTIFINSSTTALLILEYLGDKRVNIVTNNGKALNSTIGSNVSLILTGGQVYERKQSLIGEFATQTLSRVMADKCFLGVSGIAADSGISTSVFQETLVNHEMIKRCSGPIYILTDSTKVGRHDNFSSGDINELTHLITDSDIQESSIREFEEKNLTVIALDYK